MPLFTSSRERRLWLWTLVVVLGIYSTLGLARTLAGALRDRGLLDATTFVVFLGMLVAVTEPWGRRKPVLGEIWVALGVTAVYVTIFLRMLLPEERTHLFEYTVVAMLIHKALLERRDNGRPVRAPAVIAVVATALLGWLDEGIQALLPNRVYDIVDVGFNALAGLVAVVARVSLAWAGRWGRRRFAGTSAV